MSNVSAKMQHHPVHVTEGNARAMQRYLFPKPERERPHRWIRLNPDTWIFTNDGSVNQYKALVIRIKGSRYNAVIRTMSKVIDGHLQFPVFEDAKTWAAVKVYKLISEDFDFYGPDKTEEAT